MKEVYETMINEKPYVFWLQFDGRCWIARGINEIDGVMYSAFASNSESAALELVKIIESHLCYDAN
jgi:hypothetical protein